MLFLKIYLIQRYKCNSLLVLRYLTEDVFFRVQLTSKWVTEKKARGIHLWKKISILKSYQFCMLLAEINDIKREMEILLSTIFPGEFVFIFNLLLRITLVLENNMWPPQLYGCPLADSNIHLNPTDKFLHHWSFPSVDVLNSTFKMF